MLGYVGVFVVENTFDNAAKEAEIQCGERREVESVGKPVLTQVIDIARELKDACLPDFLLNASTGEFRYLIGESNRSRQAIIEEWILNQKAAYHLDGSGYKHYFVLVPVESYLITEANCGE